MSDDVWRPGRQDDEDDFGEVRFADDAHPTDVVPAIDADDGLSFGPSDTGSLAALDGAANRVTSKLFAEDRDSTDDLDVWSTSRTAQPAWKEDSGGYERSIDDDTFGDT